MAPTILSMMFSAMLTDAFYNSEIGIVLRYWFDRKLFNLQKPQAKNKVQTDIIHDFHFANDCSLNAGIQSEMQESLDLFSAACKDFGLTISTKKTKVMYQPAPAISYKEPTVTVGGEKLPVAAMLTYLGSAL